MACMLYSFDKKETPQFAEKNGRLVVTKYHETDEKCFPKKVCPEAKMFYLRRNMFTSETVSKNIFSKPNMSVCKKASKYTVPVKCFSQKDNKLSWQPILA